MRRQAIRYTLSGLVGVVLVVALTVMVNWLGARRWVRGDWTSSKIYTLSEKTVNILGELEQEIRVVVFMVPGSPLYDQARELLNRYQTASPKIDVAYIDPDREPLKTQQLATQYGISVADTVVFIYGDRNKYVTSEQMAEYDYAGMQYGQPPSMRAFKGEEQFTSAILSLVAPDVPKVYFVTGHGEASLAGGGGTLADRGLAKLGEALKRENIEAEDVILLGGSVPEDADVLAIMGPTQAFTENEIELLRAYLDDGGRLLVALDPLIEPDATMRSTRLEALLADYGVEVGEDLVVDPTRKLPFFDLSAVYLTDFPPHPVTRGLEGTAVLFTVARSVSPLAEFGATAIVETSRDGWGETDLAQLLAGQPVESGDTDTPGPAAVGVAVDGSTPVGPGPEDDIVDAEPENAFRLVAFGDSDFMSDMDVSNAGNFSLTMNTFNWLTLREQALGIAPREVEQVSLYLSQQQMRSILIVTMLVMPAAAIFLGILVWRRRRH